jgi:hypothetical protein
LLRLEIASVVCFVGVTAIPVSEVLRLETRRAGRKGNQDATPPGGVFLLRLESTTVVCFVGVTANPVFVVLRLESGAGEGERSSE